MLVSLAGRTPDDRRHRLPSVTELAQRTELIDLGMSAPFDLSEVDDTPDVVVDLGRLEANIARAAALATAHGLDLRPHVKTHKMLQVASRQIDAGAVGIQVAKLSEAEVFARAGIADIFIGYPLVGPRKIARLIELVAETATAISLATDSFDVALPIARAAVGAGRTLPLLLEVDTGLRRLGVLPGKPAIELAKRVADLDGVELVGLFTHEGHIYTQADSNDEKREMTRRACAEIVETAEAIRVAGIPLSTVSVGSSGTFRFAVECPGVTEVRPGTYVFNDLSQLLQGSATVSDIAAFVVATVVGRPEATRAVIDAGSKVLTSDRLIASGPSNTHGGVAGYPGAYVSRLSEEHGLLELPPGTDIRIGDRVAIVPNHICPVINLTDSVAVVSDGVFAERWTVAARGRVQ
jgi:D-serine deaminase-like pyridoxal phosphate-dependent protein